MGVAYCANSLTLRGESTERRETTTYTYVYYWRTDVLIIAASRSTTALISDKAALQRLLLARDSLYNQQPYMLLPKENIVLRMSRLWRSHRQLIFLSTIPYYTSRYSPSTVPESLSDVGPCEPTPAVAPFWL